jgi:hypothetical protein
MKQAKKRNYKKHPGFSQLIEELRGFPEWEIKKHRARFYSIRTDEHLKHVTYCYSLPAAFEQLLSECRSRYPNLANTTH